MKQRVMLSAFLLGSMLSGLTWSHHAAQGIVSDDVWQMIDDNLEAAESPHLNIDFDDVMGSMRVYESDDGDLFLVSNIVVYSADVDDYMAVIEPTLEEFSTMPAGTLDSGNASAAFIEIIDLESGFSEILLYEPIGNGASQVAPPPAPAPGKRG